MREEVFACEILFQGPVTRPLTRLADDGMNITADDEDEKLASDVFAGQVPTNASDPKAVDSLIASQMAKLSVHDRENVYMDVHGISSDYVVETPELKETSLVSLEHEIELLPEKQAYQLAEKSDPNYVHNRDFCLAFLRCVKFDCSKAALRIIRHFQMKLDLFGKDKLAMDITQDDYDLDDMDALYGSGGVYLDAFDSGGRVINFIDGGVPKVYKTDVVLRRAFYNTTLMTLRDEEVQRRGAVTVCWAVGDAIGTISENKDLNWKLPKVTEASPLRISAVHMCVTDETWKDRIALMRTGMAKNMKVRTRVHFGTVQECLSNLQSHGIDPRCIPLNEKKGDLLEHWCQRLEQQRKFERLHCPPRKSIGVPWSQDILLGKGAPFQNHPGNKKLRGAVAERYKEWEKALKGAKKEISEELIENIRHNGGLFLKKDGGKWVLADHHVAVLKVGASFRTLRMLHKKDGITIN